MSKNGRGHFPQLALPQLALPQLVLPPTCTSPNCTSPNCTSPTCTSPNCTSPTGPRPNSTPPRLKIPQLPVHRIMLIYLRLHYNKAWGFQWQVNFFLIPKVRNLSSREFFHVNQRKENCCFSFGADFSEDVVFFTHQF